jgi:SAM-dependent methyltransferase
VSPIPPPSNPPEELWRRANRAHWDEAASLHAASDYYDLAGIRAGRDTLRPFEDDELGPLDGRDVVHLQCHLGTDTVALARRSARVVGLDFSGESVARARTLAADCQLDIEFVQADVYDATAAVDGRRFDLVYTGIGALCWLPDLTAWADVVTSLLKPGGFLYLVEIHPMTQAVLPDGRTVRHSCIGGDEVVADTPGGTYAVSDTLSAYATHLHNWSIGEVATACLQSGLVIDLLREHEVTTDPLPWLEAQPDQTYRLPDGWPRYPLSFSLRAALPA